MSHYSNANGLNYHLYSHGQVQYQTVNAPCSTYSPTYAPGQGTSTAPLYMPPTSGPHPHYSFVSPRVPTLPSQSRAFPPNSYYAPSAAHRTTSHHQRLAPPRDYISMDGTECQDSPNEDTMLSEPVLPPLEGYPDVHEFDALMKRYVQDLSPKKQDKALIHARRAANIKHVLIDKKTTAIESAQFRFWVKKMFTLQPNDTKVPEHLKKICHEGKPVAVREKLFKILTKAHKQCQHGGRDKTSAQGTQRTHLKIRQTMSHMSSQTRDQSQLASRVSKKPRDEHGTILAGGTLSSWFKEEFYSESADHSERGLAFANSGLQNELNLSTAEPLDDAVAISFRDQSRLTGHDTYLSQSSRLLQHSSTYVVEL
ncbi:uncharacterized protein A1O5_06806 [Cladophialophora psammophila CBS 110553]|uniref:Uncharacterized protein n=1 Tax=Cladophialophora psammophila CBS 110553 TaxID=1182543 RepID=W9WXD5_9EURO|nr:uncharacterized protein A1O5_06806 [Cladophialophora psammophila CBS 110553]EXJ69735.1 hypothetical protein A1O5_06806 [Cladophialophora psammophila CBS 110553]